MGYWGGPDHVYRPMRIGISVCSNYRVQNPRDGARWMIERAAAARAADLDSLFVGDHHVTAGPYYQNVAILGRMLAEWHDRPAGALFLLPLWHPVLLAEQIGTLASIMPNRFIMQCGLGDRPQSEGMGVDFSRRVGMFEECIRIMRALWAGDTVSTDRYWNLRDARISPVPAEPVEIWVGATVLPAINRTARIADGWLGSPSLNQADAVKSLNMYRQACAEHSKPLGSAALRRDICIARTSQRAREGVAPELAKGYRGFGEEALVIGSIAEVVEQFGRYRDMGYTDIIVRNISQNQAVALETIACLGEVRAQLV
ncbi:MAG: LLM class flavin-dependent oxidoreductase [Gammaproteobacteria bacterium]|nr:LLM class flavin-dependent oxidoreductase [Gammaproteobacteria bacterium]